MHQHQMDKTLDRHIRLKHGCWECDQGQLFQGGPGRTSDTGNLLWPVTLLKGTDEEGSRTGHGSQGLEVTQVPTKGRLDKKNVAHTRALKVTNWIYISMESSKTVCTEEKLRKE